MATLPPDEIRAMAQSIDAGLEPRVRVALDLSAEAVQRLRDLLGGVATDLDHHAGIEATWPIYRLLAALEGAVAPPQT